jgi:hypothetical protein
LVQKRSFIRPVLQDATVQRTYVAPSAIGFRQVAHTMAQSYRFAREAAHPEALR